MNTKRLIVLAILIILWLPLTLPNFHTQTFDDPQALPVQLKMQALAAGKLLRLYDWNLLPPQSQPDVGQLLRDAQHVKPQAAFLNLCSALELIHSQNYGEASVLLSSPNLPKSPLSLALLAGCQGVGRPESSAAAYNALREQYSDIAPLRPLLNHILDKSCHSDLQGYYRFLARQFLSRCGLGSSVSEAERREEERRAHIDLIWGALVVLSICAAMSIFVWRCFNELWSRLRLSPEPDESKPESTSAGAASITQDAENPATSATGSTQDAENPATSAASSTQSAESSCDPLRALALYTGLQWLMLLLGAALSCLIKPDLPALLRIIFIQFTIYTLVLTALTLLWPKIYRHSAPAAPAAAWGLRSFKTGYIYWGVLGWGAALCIMPVVNALTTWFLGKQPYSINPFLDVVATSAPSQWIFILLLVSLLTPLFEEILFRGLLFGGLRAGWGVWTAGIISALVFSAMHGDPQGLPALTCLGAIFAYLYQRTGSLWSNIITHSLWNGLVVINVLYMLLW